MNPLWLATVAAWLVALPVLVVLVNRALGEMRGLHHDLRRFDELRPALVRVRTDAEEISRRLATHRQR